MTKLLSAALIGGIALLASAASAQTTAGTTTAGTTTANTATAPASIGAFPSLVAEARSKTPSTADSGVINTTLATAEWYWAAGDQAKAVSYLNFARGRLGLRLAPSDGVVQQAEHVR